MQIMMKVIRDKVENLLFSILFKYAQKRNQTDVTMLFNTI